MKKLSILTVTLILLVWITSSGYSSQSNEAAQSTEKINWEQRLDKVLKADKGDIILTGVGDMIFNREISGSPEPDCQNLYRILREAHIAYGNLEMSLNERPGMHRGLFNFRQGRDFAWEITKLGINLVSLANNHSLDYGLDGLRDCLRILNQSGISHAGGGINLAQARTPAIKEIYRTRFALLSYFIYRGSDGPTNPEDPSVSSIGMPVVLLEMPNNTLESVGAPKEADVRAMEDAIILARRRADIVMVHFHIHDVSHSRAYGVPNEVMPNIGPVMHKAIDAGADIILGNGPHVLRGIEIYKNKPIFHSIGNFIYQWKTPEVPPIVWTWDPETYSGYEGIDPKLKGMDVREESETVVLRLTIKNKKTQKIELFPATLDWEQGPTMGNPRLANNKRGKEIIEYLQKLSQPYKTKILFKEWYGEIEF